jgi:hypothetical protein
VFVGPVAFMTAMAADISRALDPVRLARDVGVEPDQWQARLLLERPRRALLCCSRQSGKTLATCLLALWVALYEAPALVLILSPSLRQSGEVFRTLMGLYQKLPGAPALAMESVLRCELANGSRVISLPGTEKTVRGYSRADLLIIDEAARVPDELLAAVRPMMATSKNAGRLIMLSTPAGRRGAFFEAWTTGGDTWDRTEVAARDCPRITPEFLAEELAQLGKQRFSEEYELAFLDPDTSVFPSEIINLAFTPEVTPLWQ